MIISHSKGACFWKVARTGSNTAELCIRMCCDLDKEQDVITPCHFFPSGHNAPEAEFSAHFRPVDAISRGLITVEQYREYDHFMMVRTPYKRFASAYALRFSQGEAPPPLEWFLDQREKVNLMNWMLVPQHEYVGPRTEVYQFSDYENSLREIVARFGGELDDVPRLAHRRADTRFGEALQALQDEADLEREVVEWYAKDFSLIE
jgi:hypothetical protein